LWCRRWHWRGCNFTQIWLIYFLRCIISLICHFCNMVKLWTIGSRMLVPSWSWRTLLVRGIHVSVPVLLVGGRFLWATKSIWLAMVHPEMHL
jgi:hypothetical protein